jgi:putative ABC transport system ATP-binding protein
MSVLLESKGLNKSYPVGKSNKVNVLKDVDLQVRKGEFIAVMGPSGSGKSTLLYNICGMDRMSSGSVVFNGTELGNLGEKELSKLRLNNMGFIFQQIHLLRNLSVFDNIILSGYLAKNRSRSDINKRARQLMEQTGIIDLMHNDITQASGGQLQRVGICRALINNPDIVFGDEPTGALDSKASEEIMGLLGSINEAGTTVLLVTHDIKVAAKAKRVLYMMDGRIAAEKELGTAPRDREVCKEREARLSAWLQEQGF